MRNALLGIIFAGLFCGSLDSVSAQAPPCGSVLATYRGVEARSNGPDQFGEDSCAGKGVFGFQYQCVEYIKRFYSQALSVDTSQWSGNAVDYFTSASAKGLLTIANSNTTPPAPDDILVFSSAGTLGHVAIVTAVSANSVTFVEENWSYSGTATLAMTYQNGVYTIANRITSKGRVFHVLGWLRKPPTEIVLQPGPDAGKDIWTTSVYSYATCSAPFPGGGAYDYELRVGGWGDLYYALLQFDLTGLPTHASSVTLQLFCYYNNAGSPTAMYLDRITQFWWNWQTTGTGCDNERLWWADKPPAIPWDGIIIPAPSAGQWSSVDITDLYNAWQSGTPNYGVQLRPVQNSDTFDNFYSSRYTGDPSLRPKLVIHH